MVRFYQLAIDSLKRTKSKEQSHYIASLQTVIKHLDAGISDTEFVRWQYNVAGTFEDAIHQLKRSRIDKMLDRHRSVLDSLHENSHKALFPYTAEFQTVLHKTYEGYSEQEFDQWIYTLAQFLEDALTQARQGMSLPDSRM